MRFADASPPPDPFCRRLLVLVFVLVCTSLVSYLPQMLELLTKGNLEDRPRSGDYVYFLSRSPREALLMCLVFYLGYSFFIARRQMFLTFGIVLVSALTASWALICTFYAVSIKDLPIAVPVLGLKPFLYTPLLLAGYIIARYQSRYGLMWFAASLRWYAALIIVIGLTQTVMGSNRDTLFGARSFGPFTNFNAYGATLVTCSLWFLCARISHEKTFGTREYGFWIGTCLAMALTTGSRTAITLAFVVAALAIHFRLPKKAKVVGLAVLATMILTFPFVFSGPLITGREVKRSNEKRLELLQDVMESFETPADLIFGCGLGLYSKSTVVLFGKNRFPGQIGNPHSTYLEIVGNFGMVGLLAALTFGLISALRGSRPETVCFLAVAGLLGIPNNLLGSFPVDALLLFLWGNLLGIGVNEGVTPRRVAMCIATGSSGRHCK